MITLQSRVAYRVSNRVKICVTAESETLDAMVASHFGQSPYFIFVDSETMKCEVVKNPADRAEKGAGRQVASIMIERGIDLLITGKVGVNTSQILAAAEIRVVQGVTGSVREAVEEYKKDAG